MCGTATWHIRMYSMACKGQPGTVQKVDSQEDDCVYTYCRQECDGVLCDGVLCDGVQCDGVLCDDVLCHGVQCDGVQCDDVQCDGV